jgi:hypothetical protein
MTTKAVEAGARAIKALWVERLKDDENRIPTDEEVSKACIEAAIASGELVPASAVAAERERCIQAIQNAPCPDEAGYYTMTKDEAIDIIRDLEPASGEPNYSLDTTRTRGSVIGHLVKVLLIFKALQKQW